MTLAMTLAYAAVLAGVFGLLLGSFLNVVAYRLPRGESLAFPGSHCPSCETPIKPYDNVPVLSWLWLRGRCRSCRGSISARYPVVEATTAALLVAVVLAKGADSDAWPGLALVLLLVPVTLIDLDHRIIPNKLMLLGTVVSVAILLVTAPQSSCSSPRSPTRAAWGWATSSSRASWASSSAAPSARRCSSRSSPGPWS